MTGIRVPEGWDELRAFVEAPRGSYGELREARKLCSQERAAALLDAYIRGAQADSMQVYQNYINAIKLDK